MLPDKQVIDPFPDSPCSGINAGGGYIPKFGILVDSVLGLATVPQL